MRAEEAATAERSTPTRWSHFRCVALLAAAAFASSRPLLIAAPPAPAPRVTLWNLNQTPFSLESLRGKVVVLDFWASWCIPCRESVPFFNGLQARFGPQGFQVIGLTLEDNEDAIVAFLDEAPAGFPIVRDPSGGAGEAFGVVAMPTAFLIDRSGRIVARFEGGNPRVHKKLEAASAALLAGSLPPGADVRVSRSLEATGGLKAWQRGYLADPIMNLDGDPLTRLLREHIHASKEAASGDGGAAGGGCGCN
jgi:thiol-disulfide isomerase/thioredoxin